MIGGIVGVSVWEGYVGRWAVGAGGGSSGGVGGCAGSDSGVDEELEVGVGEDDCVSGGTSV